MGAIQNSINQALGTIGIAARLSPELERKQEIRKITRQEQALEQVIENIEAEGAMDEEELTRTDIQISSELADVQKQKAVLTGSSQDISKYFKTKEGIRNLQAGGNPEALQKLKAKREQDERIKNFEKIFTEGGRWK